MLTDLGKFLRKLRIDRSELIKDMAEKLGVTASYVSAVETGTRNIPNLWEAKISELYHLDQNARSDLSEAIKHSAKIVKLNLETASNSKIDTAFLFAREFNTLDESDIFQIGELIKNLTKNKGSN
jgi:transcriptional regulator with XRE-family HTH domain